MSGGAIGATRCFGTADGVPLFRGAGSLIEDAKGSLWVGGNTTLLRWANGSAHCLPAKRLREQHRHGRDPGTRYDAGWGHLGWNRKAGPGLGLQRLANGRWQPFATPDLDGSALYVTALHAGSRRCAVGWHRRSRHLPYPRCDGRSLRRARGLSSDYIVGSTRTAKATSG